MVFNVDERVHARDMLHFDTDSTTMVYDNSANIHIYNKKYMFVGEIRKGAKRPLRLSTLPN